MKRVIIESPYAGDIDNNVSYARLCLKDSLMRGEAPIASHLLHTQVLDDTIKEEREMGIKAGLEWLRVAELMAVYVDLGISKGMKSAIIGALIWGVQIEYRNIL
jgi:hypothetical protein